MSSEKVNPQEIKTALEKFRQLLERETEMARKNGEFRTIVLAEQDGYKLTVNVTPNGTPMLVLVSPNLRNRFAIRDYTVLITVSELLNSVLANPKLKTVIEKTFPPKTRGNSVSVLEL